MADEIMNVIALSMMYLLGICVAILGRENESRLYIFIGWAVQTVFCIFLTLNIASYCNVI